MSSSLLPPNATPFELALEASTARLGTVTVPIDDLWNPATCPAELLPWLAWALSVDGWSSSWSEEIKRSVLAASLQVHTYKGTVAAVRKALEAAGYPDAKIFEWFETGGDPYTCEIHVHLYHEGIDLETQNRLTALVDAYKNVRSQVGIKIFLTVKSGVPSYAATALAAESVIIYPWVIQDLDLSWPFYWAAGYQSVETIVVYPQ